jgi:hypothetical protein
MNVLVTAASAQGATREIAVSTADDIAHQRQPSPSNWPAAPPSAQLLSSKPQPDRGISPSGGRRQWGMTSTTSPFTDWRGGS